MERLKTRPSVCEKKQRFKSRRLANDAMAKYKRENAPGLDRFKNLKSSYQCNVCGWWHLTKREKLEGNDGEKLASRNERA